VIHRIFGLTGILLVSFAGAGTGETKERAAQAGVGGPGSVFGRGGTWSRAEVAFLLGSQRAREELGVSRNIFGSVSAEASNVGFGEHYGGRATVFVNRWFGLEGSWFRTTSEFEFSITDAEAGAVLFEDALVQESWELAGAAILQWPLVALTPYAAFGYGSRTSEVGETEPFRSGSWHLGAGMKVPFGDLPFSMTFDYRYVRYREVNEAIQLAESGARPTASVLTVGVMLRTPGRR